MDMVVWPVVGTIYGLAYGVYGIALGVIDFQRRNPLLGIGTCVVALIGAAGLMLYCCRIHNDTAIAAWKIIVIPYVLLNLGISRFKAWKNNQNNIDSKSLVTEIGNALLVEVACLYFNVKYAFFFN